jgi:RNA polymerase sigma factor (TIGR02999 family)
MTDVTRILHQIEQGDAAASERLLPLVYDELRKLAAAKLANENPGQTLQATALVHEAYIRLVGGDSEQQWDSQGHFFAAAAEAMRRILVDQARRKATQKHGGAHQRVQFEEGILSKDSDEELLALSDALDLLEQQDPTKAKLVKLRYFAGLTTDQAAESLGIGVSTANKYWAYAKAWLRAEIHGLPSSSATKSGD